MYFLLDPSMDKAQNILSCLTTFKPLRWRDQAKIFRIYTISRWATIIKFYDKCGWTDWIQMYWGSYFYISEWFKHIFLLSKLVFNHPPVHPSNTKSPNLETTTLPKQLDGISWNFKRIFLVVHLTKYIKWYCQYATLRLPSLVHNSNSLVFTISMAVNLLYISLTIVSKEQNGLSKSLDIFLPLNNLYDR